MEGTQSRSGTSLQAAGPRREMAKQHASARGRNSRSRNLGKAVLSSLPPPARATLLRSQRPGPGPAPALQQMVPFADEPGENSPQRPACSLKPAPTFRISTAGHFSKSARLLRMACLPLTKFSRLLVPKGKARRSATALGHQDLGPRPLSVAADVAVVLLLCTLRL